MVTGVSKHAQEMINRRDRVICELKEQLKRYTDENWQLKEKVKLLERK